MSSSAPAGTLTQLAGQGARLVASPRRRVFPGRPDQVRQARRFVARALDGCPAAADAVLGVSELARNAVQHSRSGQGGRFQVLVWRGRASACVAVIDDGARRGPAPRIIPTTGPVRPRRAAGSPGLSRSPSPHHRFRRPANAWTTRGR
jgi:Histidine kinase-like ATPase domain